MSNFELYSWICCGITFVLIFLVIIKEKPLLIKPSFLFAVFFHLRIQWGSAFYANWISEFLDNPWHYFYLSHLFPLAIISVTPFLFRYRSSLVYSRLLNGDFGFFDRINILVCLLFFQVCAICAWYLSDISWSESGLFALISGNSEYAQIRENSMKLYENQSLKYAFEWMSTVFAPCLLVVIFMKVNEMKYSLTFMNIIFGLFCFFFLVVAVSLYGARGPAATLLLTGFYALFARRGFPFNFSVIASLLAIVLFFPALISLRAMGAEMSYINLFDSFVNIFDRAFGRNIFDGVWAVDYAQKEGFFGVSGIPKLAFILGRESVDTFNVIGRYYLPNDLESISANSSFVYGYYSCFGLNSIVPSLLMVLSLDLIIPIFLRLPEYLMLPCVSICAIGSMKFTYTFFTTGLVTGGFLVAPVFCFLLFFIIQIIEKASEKVIE